MHDGKIDIPDYFRFSANERASKALIRKMHNEFSVVFSGIDYFEGIFTL